MTEIEIEPQMARPFGYTQTYSPQDGWHAARQYACVTFADGHCPPGLLKAPLNGRGHEIQNREYRLINRETLPDGSVRLEFEPL